MKLPVQKLLKKSLIWQRKSTITTLMMLIKNPFPMMVLVKNQKMLNMMMTAHLLVDLVKKKVQNPILLNLLIRMKLMIHLVMKMLMNPVMVMLNHLVEVNPINRVSQKRKSHSMIQQLSN